MIGVHATRPRVGWMALTVLACLVVPRPVAAQDVTVNIRVSRELVAEIQEAFRNAVDESARELRTVIRDVHVLVPEIESALRDVGVWVQNRSWRGRATKQETRSVRVPPGGSLELRNISGPVTVVAGTSGRVELTLVHTARASTDARAERALGDDPLRVTESGNRVVIEGAAEQDRDASVSTAFTVAAPPDTNISIATVAGSVNVTGIRGTLAVETAVGAVTIRDARHLTSVRTMTGAVDVRGVDHDGVLEVGTINGSLTLDGVRVRRLAADTVSGQIIARAIRAGGVKLTSMSGAVTFGGDLERAGRYEFHSHNGQMDLALGGSGFDLDATTFRGQVQVNPALGLRATTSGPRAVRGVVGDGGAVVEATTFNGHLIIRRK